jgi:hypothetical protein
VGPSVRGPVGVPSAVRLWSDRRVQEVLHDALLAEELEDATAADAPVAAHRTVHAAAAASPPRASASDSTAGPPGGTTPLVLSDLKDL